MPLSSFSIVIFCIKYLVPLIFAYLLCYIFPSLQFVLIRILHQHVFPKNPNFFSNQAQKCMNYFRNESKQNLRNLSKIKEGGLNFRFQMTLPYYTLVHSRKNKQFLGHEKNTAQGGTRTWNLQVTMSRTSRLLCLRGHRSQDIVTQRFQVRIPPWAKYFFMS